MQTLYIKSIFEDGTVYFKITSINSPKDDYIYEGLELINEENQWEIDEYELTAEDLQEMYEDGFFDIEEKEFIEAYEIARQFQF